MGGVGLGSGGGRPPPNPKPQERGPRARERPLGSESGPLSGRAPDFTNAPTGDTPAGAEVHTCPGAASTRSHPLPLRLGMRRSMAVQRRQARSSIPWSDVLFNTDLGVIVRDHLCILALVALRGACSAAIASVGFSPAEARVAAAEYGKSHACQQAVVAGDLRLLQWMRAIGLPWGLQTARYATICRQWDILRYLIESGCPWTSEKYPHTITEHSAQNGALWVLEFVKREGKLPSSLSVELHAAAIGGHVEIMRWLESNGADLKQHKDLCGSAATGGSLDCLKLARARGCPFDNYTCFRAAIHGHVHSLAWLIDNGAPLGEAFHYYFDQRMPCVREKLQHVTAFLKEKGLH